MDDAEVTDAVLLFFEDDWAARTAVKNLRPFVDYLCHFVIAFVVFTVIVVVIIVDMTNIVVVIIVVIVDMTIIVVVIIVVIVDMTIIAVNVGTIIWN